MGNGGNKPARRRLQRLVRWFAALTNDLRYQILADDGAECDVGNWNADDKADDLYELIRLRNGSSTGTDECGCETADDQRNKPRAANSYNKKEQPRFEVLEFCRFFGHRGV